MSPVFNSASLVFSQGSLQDYLECPRRFELGFLKDTPWPAPQSSPLSSYEKLTETGNQFHLMCHQFFSGIDPDLIAKTAFNSDLLDLWQSFQPYALSLLGYPSFTEQILRIPFMNHFLVAKYDLIVMLPENEFLIVDWKTSKQKPTRTSLSSRVQTILYPLIFYQSVSDLFSVDYTSPSSIKMLYRYPLSSEPEELFPYSETKHEEAFQFITDLIAQIEFHILENRQFALTDDLSKCEYCKFRSFCERGYHAPPIPPGTDLESEDLSSTYFDIDMIEEIEF